MISDIQYKNLWYLIPNLNHGMLIPYIPTVDLKKIKSQVGMRGIKPRGLGPLTLNQM